ncbi:MAG TPA: glutathione S-transferase family protein [Polyangiaceae bacterium]|jgi:glutathione S-transferase|nr:glutathione S-transferase family protein [Polyangiaceae bacterium]
MSKPKLTYFDAPTSRGEECRLALHAAGVDFEDVRLTRNQWSDLKPKTPFGSLPTYEIPGKPTLAQSNAILVMIGREHGLHPTDTFEAARHEAMMMHVEDLRAAVGPTIWIEDAAEKKRARERLVETFFPLWGERAERQIGDGPFFGGSKLCVVDIKLHMVVRWFHGGTVDHIPATIFDKCTKLMRVHDAVGSDPRIVAWRARH